MRRVIMVVLLLVGTSSCMVVKQNPTYGQASSQAVSTRPTPPSPVKWTNPSGGLPSSDGAEPLDTGRLAQAIYGDPPPPRDARPISPPPALIGAQGTPYAPGGSADPNPGLNAYAGSSGYGYGTPTSALKPVGAGNTLPGGSTAMLPPPLPTPLPGSPIPASGEGSEGVQQVSYTDRTNDKLPSVISADRQSATWPASGMPMGASTSPGGQQQYDLIRQPVSPESDLATTPPGPICRMVNTKRITLNFELKDAGGAGVTGVDLYATRDLKSWKKMDAVRPTPNSYVIDVKDEGWYGFMMSARTSAVAPAPPKAGDVPQVMVTVDTTKPVVLITGVELSLTSRIPALVIRWNAQDRNFNKRPITISYAESPDGPWMPLASGLENTGRHEIPLSQAIPHRMLLRVEAIDGANNIGSAQTREPIRLELPWSVAERQTEGQHEQPAPRTMDLIRPAPSVVNVGVE
jgi:hypothetical protein